MQIELRTRSLVADLIVKSGNAQIEEDLAVIKNGVGYIPDAEIENLVNIARQMNSFNDKSDVDFVKMIYDAFLNDSERREFLELVTENED